MKRKLIALLAAMTVAAMLVGCGSAASGSISSSDDSAQETDVSETKAGKTVEDDEDITPSEYYVSDGELIQYEDNNDAYYEQYYSISLYDDGSAIMCQDFYYSWGSACEYTYVGTYVKQDDTIRFTYVDAYSPNTYSMTAKDGVLTNVEYVSSSDYDISVIAGTYEGETELGDAVLTIEEDGTAELSVNDGQAVYTGSVMDYDNNWDLMVSNEDMSENYDWIVTFDGNTFTYETFTHMIYGKFEGTYDIVGDLGTLRMIVDGEGHATLDAKIDGQMMTFTGNIYGDREAGVLSSAYLYSDDGNILDLNFNVLDDGTLNYYGNYSIPLAAG